MIQLPKRHLADETLARIAVASKRTRERSQAAPELEPAPGELVDLPPSLMPAKPIKTAETPEAAPPEAPPPPLNETGLDMGLVLHGADSFDALLKT